MRRVKQLFVEAGWGGRSLIALYLSLFSGLVIALQYDPGHPFYSSSSLELLAPFGVYWRSLHFYASQLFFLTLLLHFLAVVVDNSELTLVPRLYLSLVGSLVAALLLLFTGYILRGDATGAMAGAIAENIARAIPLVGEGVNNLLFAVSREGMRRVYAQHLAGLGLLWLLLAWEHLRRYRAGWDRYGVFALLLVGGSMLWPAPMEPERLGSFHISGPWFFIGLQELLRYLPPLLAGVLWPLALVGALFLLRRPGVWRRRAKLFILLWLGLYLLLTIIGWSRGW